MASNNSKTMTTLAVVAVSAGLIIGVNAYLSSQRENAKRAVSSRSKGSDKAPIKIVEFIDFQCPACAEGAKYLKKIMAEQPALIHLEMKYFPLPMHRHGVLSAQYAECAARQDQFWPMHDFLIERQSDWRNLEYVKDIFDLMADEIDVDRDIFDDCLEDTSVMDVLKSNKEEGAALGVKSTPSYFINGEMVVGYKNLADKILQLSPKP